MSLYGRWKPTMHSTLSEYFHQKSKYIIMLLLVFYKGHSPLYIRHMVCWLSSLILSRQNDTILTEWLESQLSSHGHACDSKITILSNRAGIFLSLPVKLKDTLDINQWTVWRHFPLICIGKDIC
jgi:hypothetical protein